MPKEFKIGYAASAMPVRYAVERKQWADAAHLAPVTGAQPHVEALTVWARSLGFARSGNPAAARKESEKLKSLYEQLRSGSDQYWTTQVHVQLTESLAWIAQAEGKHDEAVKLLTNAADEEDGVEKRPVTPGAVIPAREQLGDLLLELNRPKEAAKEFAGALHIAPQRRNALAGAGRAAASAGEGVSKP